MASLVDSLVALLALQRLGESEFCGQSQDLGWGNVFGGQVLGQALSAAGQTVPADRRAHSMHGYFLRTGDARLPVRYEVDPIRDGRSFTTRRVVAKQQDQAIFTMAASFQIDESGFDHQVDAPAATGPEGLASEVELARRIATQIPEPLRTAFTAEHPIEIRPVQVHSPLDPEVGPPRWQLWVRAAAPLPDDDAVHRQLLAYASDFHLLEVAMQPHGVSWMTPGMHVASLDHAIWFHRPFRLDDWLLYVIDAPSSSGARGFARGAFFDTAGRLIASVAQEGLIRPRPTDRPRV